MPLNSQVGLEPRVHAEVVQLLHHPPADVADGCFAGRDHFVRKGTAGDDVGREDGGAVVFEFFGQACIEKFGQQVGGGNEFLFILRPEGFGQKFVSVVRQPALLAARAADVECDRFRVAFVDDFFDRLAEFVASREEHRVVIFQPLFGITYDGDPLDPLAAGR